MITGGRQKDHAEQAGQTQQRRLWEYRQFRSLKKKRVSDPVETGGAKSTKLSGRQNGKQ